MRTKLEKRIRWTLIGFITLLVLSGVTAVPVEWELGLAAKALVHFNASPATMQWFNEIHVGVLETNRNYPFIAYAFDWLAFAHIVIATVFIGPLRDPVKNSWVLQFGMIACILVFPMAFIAGPLRGIPFFWQLIDCSFGVLGFIPLWACFRWTKKLELAQINQAEGN